MILSKFLDCYSTQLRLKHIGDEKNPLGRSFMKINGPTTGIWLVFLISLAIIGLSTYLLLRYYNNWYYKVIFILVGVFITLIQLLVAHHNITGKNNIVVKILKNSNFYKN